MKFVVKLLLSSIIICLLANLLPGVTLSPPYTNALLVALVLVLLNNLLKPILVILTLPITIVTLGFFLLIINALIILIAAKLLIGFQVSSIWTALIFSVLLSISQSILYKAVKEDTKS